MYGHHTMVQGLHGLQIPPVLQWPGWQLWQAPGINDDNNVGVTTNWHVLCPQESGVWTQWPCWQSPGTAWGGGGRQLTWHQALLEIFTSDQEENLQRGGGNISQLLIGSHLTVFSITLFGHRRRRGRHTRRRQRGQRPLGRGGGHRVNSLMAS